MISSRATHYANDQRIVITENEWWYIEHYVSGWTKVYPSGKYREAEHCPKNWIVG